MYALDNAVSLRIFYSGNAWFDTVIRKKVSEILFEFRTVVENNGTRLRVPREPVVFQLARHGRTVLVDHGVKFEPACGLIDEGYCLQLAGFVRLFVDGDRSWTDEVHAYGVPWGGFRAFHW